LAFVSIALVGACGGGAEEPMPGEESSGGEEAGDSSYEGPITSTEIDAGKAIFETHCEDCHPGGEEDVGPSLIADPHSPARLRQQIREGSGKMRPFSSKRISDGDLESLLAYLQSIGAVN
jgi:mono/diheme cytochrome c family protein